MGREQIQTKSEIEMGIGRDIEIDIETRGKRRRWQVASPFFATDNCTCRKGSQESGKKCMYLSPASGKQIPAILVRFSKIGKRTVCKLRKTNISRSTSHGKSQFFFCQTKAV